MLVVVIIRQRTQPRIIGFGSCLRCPSVQRHRRNIIIVLECPEIGSIKEQAPFARTLEKYLNVPSFEGSCYVKSIGERWLEGITDGQVIVFVNQSVIILIHVAYITRLYRRKGRHR